MGGDDGDELQYLLDPLHLRVVVVGVVLVRVVLLVLLVLLVDFNVEVEVLEFVFVLQITYWMLIP